MNTIHSHDDSTIRSHLSTGRGELSFLRDKTLRDIAERDLASLTFARRSNEVKTAIIMAGSVIEAVLLDCISRVPESQVEEAVKKVQAQRSADPRFSNFSAKNGSFIHQVALCGRDGLGILRGRTERVADTLRDFRNLVHPARERKEFNDSPLRTSDADAAEALTLMVLEDVKAWALAR